jgi:hypothetical protein
MIYETGLFSSNSSPRTRFKSRGSPSTFVLKKKTVPRNEKKSPKKLKKY